MKDNKELVILAGKGGGGGGSGTDSNAVHYTADSGKSDAERAAALANVGGQPKRFVITVTESSGVYSADKTFAEIIAAIEDGRDCIVMYGERIATLFMYDEDYAVFESVLVGQTSVNTTVAVSKFLVDNNDDWTVTEGTFNDAPTVHRISSATVSIEPGVNDIYICDPLTAVTSLTVTNPPAVGAYVIRFNSGSTATTTSIPNTIHGLESFAAEANTHYEINVLDNYAVVGSWAVS